MKPIEPGCLCLCFSSASPGQCTALERVTAGREFPVRRTGNGLRVGGDDDFLIGQVTADGWLVEMADGSGQAVPADHHLIRIDGGESESVDVDEDLEVPA